ncbi:pol-like protein [Lasius niger]|uniref:Pol-like protein n=1 Tax=Lasius niger TaxID=67767 RepID=A0A0J7K8V6_LASNI|nr:pol-like protein [Lasius niger]
MLNAMKEKRILKAMKETPSEVYFGFRRGLSCIDNIATLITDIHMANKERKFTGAVFLDSVGIFDNVIPEALLTLLIKYGLPTKIITFIKATITHHNLTGYAAGINFQRRQTTRGLPQGSILSPILFNLYLALSCTCLPETVKIITYAEDIAIYYSNGNLEHIKDQLNPAIDNLKNFLRHLGLTISPIKSQCDHFYLPDFLEFVYNSRHFDPQIDTETGFRIRNDPNILDSFNLFLSSLKQDASFYTDSSKMVSNSDSPDGVGYVVYSPGLNFEFLAISQALNIIINKGIKRAVIFSDSLSVFTSLQNPILSGRTHHWILQIRNSLFNCNRLGLETKLLWIPSHCGITGNERVNLLAKECTFQILSFLVNVTPTSIPSSKSLQKRKHLIY